LLIFLEFYTPGGVFAVAGALFVLGAMTTFMVASGSPLASLVFVVGTVIGVCIVIWFAINRIRKSGKQDTFYLSRDQEGYQSVHLDPSLIGKKGTALTDFGPSGFVLVEGKRYAAICRGPYLDKGKEVLIIGGEGADLIVKPLNL